MKIQQFELQGEERVFKTPRMEGVKVTYGAEDGKSFTHTIIKSQPSTAVIIFSEKEEIAFLKQLRSTTGKWYMELPAGLYEPQKDHNILDTAVREAREETGLLVKNVYILVKCPSLLDPSKSNEDFGVAVANVSGKTEQELDENEKIAKELIWLPKKEVYSRLLKSMNEGEFFYDKLHMSGHSMYALLAYFFQKNNC